MDYSSPPVFCPRHFFLPFLEQKNSCLGALLSPLEPALYLLLVKAHDISEVS